MDRNERARLIYHAERLERETKGKGQRNGALGQTGLMVLRALLFRFAPCPAPSYGQLQRWTGLCRQAIADALGRLEAAGLVNRRKRWDRRGWRMSSLYTVQSLSGGWQEKTEKKERRWRPLEQLSSGLAAALAGLQRGIEERAKLLM